MQNRPIRTFTILVCLAMLLAPWAASVVAEPETASTPSILAAGGALHEGARPQGPEQDPQELRTLRSDLLASIDDEGRVDVARLLETLRHEASAATGVDLTQLPDRYGVPTSGPGEASTSDEADFHVSGTVRIPIPGGDLDGDGLEDTLVYEIDYATFRIDLAALDGADGTLLWNLTGSEDVSMVPMPVGDLDGDGTDDLVVVTLALDGDTVVLCPVFACAWQSAYTLQWGLQGLSGADGTTLWARSVDGAYDDAFAYGYVPFASFTIAQAVRLENVFVMPVPMGDVDGDGGVDLLWSAYDVDLVWLFESAGFLAGAFGYAAIASWDLDAAVLHGGDGSEGTTISVQETADFPVATPVADLDGDGAPDLVVVAGDGLPYTAGCGYTLITFTCAAATGPGSDLVTRAFSSADGETLWSTTDSDPRFAYRFLYRTADLSGDGADDLVVVGVDRLAQIHIQAFDGQGAGLLWSLEEGEEPLHFLDVAGDVDGDGAQDLLWGGYDWDADLWTVGALSGAAGGDLWTLPVAVDAYYSWWERVDLADLDGDGVADLLLTNIIVDADWDDQTLVHAVRGADGTPFWSYDAPGYAFPRVLGDLDGDGADDLLRLEHVYLGDGIHTFNWTALDGADLLALWSTERTIESPAFIGSNGLKDTTGDGRTEVGLILGDQHDEIRTGVEALSGADATLLWSYGDVPPEADPGDTTPPPTLNGDADTGTDAGDSAEGAILLTPGTYNGSLDPAADDHEDWYGIELVEREGLEVVMDPDSADFDLELYAPDGTTRLDGSYAGGSFADQVSTQATETATYYVRVFQYSGSGVYTLTLDVEAPPEPPTVTPRIESFDFEGLVACSAAAGPVATKDHCGDLGAEGRTRFDVPFGAGVTGIHVEVAWSANDLFGAQTMRLSWSNPPGLEEARGESVLVHDQDVAPTAPWNYDATDATFEVRPTGAEPGVVRDQAFDVCVTVQYGGEALPAGHTCFP